jgi:hypothetical protein
MNLERRLEKLERLDPAQAPEVFRVLTRATCGRPNLATSTCTRTLMPNGHLSELVTLDGGRDGLSDADLDRFVAGFPIDAHK